MKPVGLGAKRVRTRCVMVRGNKKARARMRAGRMSGRVGGRSLLTPSPLRTVRASFHAYGSSLYKMNELIKHRLHSNLSIEVDLDVTIGVHQNAIS